MAYFKTNFYKIYFTESKVKVNFKCLFLWPPLLSLCCSVPDYDWLQPFTVTIKKKLDILLNIYFQRVEK